MRSRGRHPHPDVVAFLQLQHVEDEDFLEELAKLEGGREARDAIRAWLDKYGMRCVGEIDITRPRWSEGPSTLPVALSQQRGMTLAGREHVTRWTVAQTRVSTRTWLADPHCTCASVFGSGAASTGSRRSR
jgi:hypothetical protein